MPLDVDAHHAAAAAGGRRCGGFVPAHADACGGEVSGVGVGLRMKGCEYNYGYGEEERRTWKQMRLAPSMPSRISLRPGGGALL
jgi:hypothetical protein